MKLFEVFAYFRTPDDWRKFLKLWDKIKESSIHSFLKADNKENFIDNEIKIYRAEIENYADKDEMIIKMMVYHTLLLLKVHVKDIKMPIRILDKFKHNKAALQEKAVEVLKSEKYGYKWDEIQAFVLGSISYWDKNTIETQWFHLCFQPRPAALNSKEYSPGRYRYFNLPLDPFMSVEWDKNNYLMLSMKKFSYLWNQLIKRNELYGIKHFKLEIRQFEDLWNFITEFKDGFVYIIDVKLKQAHKYKFSHLTIGIDFDYHRINFFDSDINSLIEVKDIYQFESQDMEEVKINEKIQKELLDYWGYHEEIKTDYLFIEWNNRTSATIINRFDEIPKK